MYRRILLRIFGEAAGLVLLLAFVISLAAMPPLQVRPAPSAATGYKVSVDTAQWGSRIGAYVETLRSGSLGKDRRGMDVLPLVMQRLGNSLTLVGLALLLALGLGVLKGFWDFSQLRRKGVALGPVITGAVQGLPDFWVILVIQYGTARLYNLTGWVPFSAAWSGDTPVRSLVFPVITLALIPWASVARITSTAMMSVYEKEYVRTARAKGLHEFKVVYKHALRGALVQIIDGLPGVLAVMVANLLIVEYLFNYPGLTILLREALIPSALALIQGRGAAAGGQIATDLPVLAVAGVALGLIFWALYLAVRTLRQVADPRLKERDGT